VRLFIEKKLAHHNRRSHYYWPAYRAEPAEAAITAVTGTPRRYGAEISGLPHSGLPYTC
jgi:hypothetical protein